MEIAGRRWLLYHACLGGELVFDSRRFSAFNLASGAMKYHPAFFLHSKFNTRLHYGRRKGPRKGMCFTHAHVKRRRFCTVVSYLLPFGVHEGSVLQVAEQTFRLYSVTSRTNFKTTQAAELVRQTQSHHLISVTQTTTLSFVKKTKIFYWITTSTFFGGLWFSPAIPDVC